MYKSVVHENVDIIVVTRNADVILTPMNAKPAPISTRNCSMCLTNPISTSRSLYWSENVSMSNMYGSFSSAFVLVASMDGMVSSKLLASAPIEP